MSAKDAKEAKDAKDAKDAMDALDGQTGPFPVSRTRRGDFILVLACGATVTSSEGFRERVRQYLETLKL